MKIPDDIEPSVLAIIYSLSNLEHALQRFYRGEAIRKYNWLAPATDWALENGLLYARRSRAVGVPLLVHDKHLLFAKPRGFRVLTDSRILWCFHERNTPSSSIFGGVRAAQLALPREPTSLNVKPWYADAELLARREWFFGYDYASCAREFGSLCKLPY